MENEKNYRFFLANSYITVVIVGFITFFIIVFTLLLAGIFLALIYEQSVVYSFMAIVFMAILFVVCALFCLLWVIFKIGSLLAMLLSVVEQLENNFYNQYLLNCKEKKESGRRNTE